ncbi:MAG TPA: glycosyltransferase family 39 protein [Solirubrobacteraceae bacterium]|jgi:4-amino-4-deoxy-L-arabinose transferase-like glycosyltransferase|nr:glycosyltransferase family 39 protein [Solirubrobacteraceae bacterium]
MSAPRQAATLPSSDSQSERDAGPGLRGHVSRRVTRLGWHHLALAGVLVLSAVVNTHRLSQNGYGNIFYSAGDKSMLRSLHNFFFASFDPGGLVTVDKPPLGLWLQTASAKLFGFAPLSLLLPEAILGVLGVLLLYRALARRLGGWAGVAGALALAVFPSFVAVSRTTNVDTLLIVLMLLACDAGVRAVENGRWRTLIWSGVLVGLAFNTKTLAAYLAVPGIALAVLLGARSPISRRLLALLAAGLAMVVVSFCWMAVVEATPKSQRPYVGSSTNNTELGLTFSYNGFGRVGGQTGGPGQIPVGAGGVARKVSPVREKPGEATHTHTAPEAPEKTVLLPNGRARNPIAFGGPTGPFRLFGRGLGDQGAWLVPFALVGLLAFALLVLGDGRRRGWQPADRARLALLLAFGGWFVVEAAVLSLSKGIVHPYYVSALGPGVAAMVGAGAFAFAQFAKRRDWRLLLLVAAVAATVPVQLSLLHKADYMSWFELPLIALAVVGLIGAALATFALRRAAPPAIALLLCLLAIAPAVFSASNWLAPVQSTFPAAGPRAAAGPGGYGVDEKHVDVDRALLRYVVSHRPGTSWAVLGDASNTVSPMILLGARAGALGGFSGTDPVLSGRGLARLVAAGRARYVVLGGEFSTRGGNGATVAVQRACRVVSTRSWLPRPLEPNGLILFDCAGRQAVMSAA